MNRNDKKIAIYVVLFLIICLLLSHSPALSAEFGNYYKAEYVRNYDGDTLPLTCQNCILSSAIISPLE